MNLVILLDRASLVAKSKITADALLLEAEQLVMLGYARAAAVIGRAAIERALFDACDASGCYPRSN